MPAEEIKEWCTPVIRSPRGSWSNHHWLDNGSIGERVTLGTGTHVIVVRCHVEEIGR